MMIMPEPKRPFGIWAAGLVASDFHTAEVQCTMFLLDNLSVFYVAKCSSAILYGVVEEIRGYTQTGSRRITDEIRELESVSQNQSAQPVRADRVYPGRLIDLRKLYAE